MIRGIILPMDIPEEMELREVLKQSLSLCRHLNVAISFTFRDIYLIIHSYELEEVYDSAVEYFQIYNDYKDLTYSEILNLKQIKS